MNALTVRALLFCFILAAARAQLDFPSEPPENTLGRHLPVGVTTRLSLPYVSNGGEARLLDLYLPAGKDGAHPLVVFVHGGGWVCGSKADCPQSLGGLLRKGFAVASISYRLSRDARFPAQLEDCKAAIRWLRAHAADYRLATDRIGVVGPSAGGHLVALLGTTGGTRDFDVGENLKFSSAVQAVVDCYGPIDLAQMDAHRLSGSKIRHNASDSAEARLLGGPVQDPENRAAVRRANPLTYLTSSAPPFVIIHGDADPMVPHYQSELLYAALVTVHVPVHFVTIHGGGHGERFPVPEISLIEEAFFDRTLRGAPAPTDEAPARQSELAAIAGS